MIGRLRGHREWADRRATAMDGSGVTVFTGMDGSQVDRDGWSRGHQAWMMTSTGMDKSTGQVKGQ